MQRGVSALQTRLCLPQYLIPAPYYRAKQGHQSPSRKEALTACFGCGPSYEFLLGMLARCSEVKVKGIPGETPQLTASTSRSHNFHLYFIPCQISSLGMSDDPTNFLSASCASTTD